MTGDLTFVPGPNGALEIQIANANATLNNFNFSISSFLNGLVQLGLIQDAIRDTVEDSLEATVGDIVAFVNPLLADFAWLVHSQCARGPRFSRAALFSIFDTL